MHPRVILPVLFAGAFASSLGGCLSTGVAPGVTSTTSNAAGQDEAANLAQMPLSYDPGKSLAPLVEHVGPSVVYIEVESKVAVQTPQIPQQWAPFFGLQAPDGQGGEHYQVRQGAGSGFIISSDGYVLTNHHVVDGADKVTVTLADDRKFKARVIGTDPRTDVAVVKIDTDQDLPAVQLGDSDKLRVGDWVVAIGNPFGLEHTVTAGIVSAKGRAIGAGPYDDFIQTDASINPGNSGGPLFNLSGEVVGMNTAIVPQGQGIGFAVPVEMIDEVLDELKAGGKVTRGWIGVGLQPLDPVLSRQLDADSGVVVSQVYPDNPASKAGLEPGDVITRVDDQDISQADEVIRAIGRKKPGETVKLDATRDGKERTFKVTLGERPDEDDVASRSFAGQDEGKDDSKEHGAKRDENATERYGIRVEDPRSLGDKEQDGAVVSAVSVDGPAHGRLKAGDRIKEINHQRIRGASEVGAALARSPDGAVLGGRARRPGHPVSLPAPEDP